MSYLPPFNTLLSKHFVNTLQTDKHIHPYLYRLTLTNHDSLHIGGHITEIALVQIKHNSMMLIEPGKPLLLSAAFDTVDHFIPFSKLKEWRLHGLIGSTVDHRSLPPEVESRHGHS